MGDSDENEERTMRDALNSDDEQDWEKGTFGDTEGLSEFSTEEGDTGGIDVSGDNLTPEEAESIAQEIMEHVTREHEITREDLDDGLSALYNNIEDLVRNRDRLTEDDLRNVLDDYGLNDIDIDSDYIVQEIEENLDIEVNTEVNIDQTDIEAAFNNIGIGIDEGDLDVEINEGDLDVEINEGDLEQAIDYDALTQQLANNIDYDEFTQYLSNHLDIDVETPENVDVKLEGDDIDQISQTVVNYLDNNLTQTFNNYLENNLDQHVDLEVNMTQEQYQQMAQELANYIDIENNNGGTGDGDINVNVDVDNSNDVDTGDYNDGDTDVNNDYDGGDHNAGDYNDGDTTNDIDNGTGGPAGGGITRREALAGGGLLAALGLTGGLIGGLLGSNDGGDTEVNVGSGAGQGAGSGGNGGGDGTPRPNQGQGSGTGGSGGGASVPTSSINGYDAIYAGNVGGEDQILQNYDDPALREMLEQDYPQADAFIVDHPGGDRVYAKGDGVPEGTSVRVDGIYDDAIEDGVVDGDET
jgi:hypothetical protein